MLTIQTIGYSLLLLMFVALFVLYRKLEMDSKRDAKDLGLRLAADFGITPPKRRPFQAWTNYYFDISDLFEAEALKKYGDKVMEDGRTFKDHINEKKARLFDERLRKGRG